jgi:hypothetical protein
VGKASIISEVAAIGRHMAKSDSFYIRAKVVQNGTTYTQEEIDLGSFVNLGVKSSTLLRIHNIAVQYADGNEVQDAISGASALKFAWQLTTQSQSAMVYADDKSLVSSGSLGLYNAQTAEDGSAAADFSTGFVTDRMDIAPQHWRNGYLVGVDSMFLGIDGNGTATSGNIVVSVVMECTLESATQASATALALSQQ